MKIILVDAVYTLVSEEGKIFDDMHKMLETYQNRKIILTNADYENDNKFGLNDMPYEIFTLKHNPNKTDPEYYKQMLKHFDLTKDDVVYFEHNADAVKSAESVGITAYNYDKDKKDLEALKKFLDENL